MSREYLSKEFLEKYENKDVNFSPIGEFVFLRTYSRFINEENRRETWFETCKRVVNYSVSLEERHREKLGLEVDECKLEQEAELMFKNLFELKTFPSGRTLFMGGTEIVEQYGLSNFNCCFTTINDIEDFRDIFYLLMLGCGVGCRITKEEISDLPSVHATKVQHLYYGDLTDIYTKEERENTKVNYVTNNTVEIVVGDSKEGWCDALVEYLKIVTDNTSEVKDVVFDYTMVRPAGERLERFGGRASGHKSLQRMFEKISNIINNANERLSTLDVLDIATIISENVVSGGVRRSAMIILCDKHDEDLINAKRNIFKVIDGQWITDETISHRTMSNNSILFFGRPTYTEIQDIMESIKVNGEPAFINVEEASRRKPTFEGTNPCGEILLQNKQCCNLSTNSVQLYAKNGKLDIEALLEGLRLSTRIAIRMTLIDLELPRWDRVMKEDRIIGISMTGIMDLANSLDMTLDQLKGFFKACRMCVRDEAERYSEELGITPPELCTTLKPEGTISCLSGASSGIHYPHSEYFIRRIRVSVDDPLYKTIRDMDCFPIYPEVGQTEETMTTAVIEFPMRSPQGKTKFDVSAIEQLEVYKASMENWTDHNTSITVSVRDDEWEDCVDWLYENWDCVVGVTFLPLTAETYPLLPFECTTQEDYVKRMRSFKKIDMELLKQYEVDEEFEVKDDDCASGHCPVR